MILLSTLNVKLFYAPFFLQLYQFMKLQRKKNQISCIGHKQSQIILIGYIALHTLEF